MKYLKTFENIKKFKIGDYVVAINLNYITYDDDIKEYMESIVAKVINVINNTYTENNIFIKYSNQPEELSDYFNSMDGDYIIYILSDNNLRFATPEEIEDYKMKENSNKYNL